MTVKTYNIKYDTDGDKKIQESLPKELVLSGFEDINDVENTIADAISDATGFCVFSCEYEIIA